MIIISARDSIDDRIKGLQLGADDYLVKPFHLSELSARIAAVIRRRRFSGNSLLEAEELTLNTQARTVQVNGQPVELTRTEYDLLLYLLTNRNRVVSKHAIAEHLSADGEGLFDNYDFIYAHMKNLAASWPAPAGRTVSKRYTAWAIKWRCNEPEVHQVAEKDK